MQRFWHTSKFLSQFFLLQFFVRIFDRTFGWDERKSFPMRGQECCVGGWQLNLKSIRCSSSKWVPWEIQNDNDRDIEGLASSLRLHLIGRVCTVKIGPNLAKIHLMVLIPFSTVFNFRMTWYNVPFKADYWEKIEVRWVGKYSIILVTSNFHIFCSGQT